MAAIPPWMLGKHLTAVAITPLTLQANGTLLAGSTQDIHAFIQEIGHEQQIEEEDVRPVWSLRINMVDTGVGNPVDIVALKRSDSANVLAALLAAGETYFQVVWTEAGEQYSVIGKRGGGQFGGIRNRGGNAISLRLSPVDAGPDTIVYSS